MKILGIDLPKLPELNLSAMKMSRLGPIVAIAGRNGAGKSRLLKTIENLMGPQFVVESEVLEQIANLENVIKGNPSHNSMASWTRQKGDFETALTARRCIQLTHDRRPSIVRFVPSKLELINPGTLPPTQAMQAANSIDQLGVDHLPRGTFARIQVCQDRRWEATHPDKTISPEDTAKAIAEYDRLKQLITKFLNTTLTRSIAGEAELFGLSLGSTGLSDGQKVILQLCMAIHAQATNLNEVIVFMDEPENHLHPAALLDLIDVVREHLKDGQIWIATHSVPLLANIDSADIWWMENGGISKAGTKPEMVLAGLLGDDIRRDRLASFLDLPFVLASNKFASECLIPPPTVAHAIADPQMHQISQILQHLREGIPQIRILDFGAGRGRLPSEIAEAWSSEQRAKLDYIAFDTSTNDSEECLAAITRLHDDPRKRLFHDATALRGQYDEGSFHVIVMCNVLHEILPTDWSDLFGADGKITRLLHSNGFLLLVEVQQLPYGERAHHQGFLVLDTAQLRKLFSVTENDQAGFSAESARDGWLKAHMISKALVSKFTDDTRRQSLEDLRNTARDRIKGLRSGAPDYRQGRLHGFWVQQFANASLALS